MWLIHVNHYTEYSNLPGHYSVQNGEYPRTNESLSTLLWIPKPHKSLPFYPQLVHKKVLYMCTPYI